MALISHQKKFIFVHIYKCAGTSMRQVLEPYCKPSLLKRGLNKLGFLKLTNSYNIQSEVPHHPTALEIKKYLNLNIYNRYFKFAFVRNPWDMEVSLYNYMLQNQNHRQHEIIKNMKNFDEYIEWRVNKNLHSQSKYVLDEKGNIIVDFIGKYERLDEDFYIIKKTSIYQNNCHT